MECDPKTREEYDRLTTERVKITGFGVGNVHQETPCPFCCAPGFLKYEILECRSVLEKEHVCGTCGRGTKMIFEEVADGLKFEIVQTRGEDPPAFLPPMRRVT